MTDAPQNTRETRRTLCRMCSDRCGLVVRLRDGRIEEVGGDRDHRFSHGRLCLKGHSAAEMANHPERLTTPLRRVGDEWQEVELAEALDEIAVRIDRIATEHGRRSIGVWKGEAVGFAQQEWLARRFAHAIGTPNYLSNDSMCAVARMIAYQATYGVSMPVPDYENAECIVVWGSDPPASLPNVAHAISEARRRGAEVVVVDPRRSPMARRATLHAPVLPGTDGALVWALVRELIVSGGYDEEFVAAHTVGFDEVEAYARSFTPEVAEAETGVTAETIRRLAALLAQAAPRVAMYTGNGLEHYRGGVETVRAIAMLQGVLGTVDRKGGALHPPPSPLRDLTLYDEVPLDHLEPIGADRFPLLYAVHRECHSLTALKAVLDDTPSALRALIVTGGNPALTNPHSERVKAALSSLDLLVVRELFMSETAELADWVLPAASFLERSDFHLYPEVATIALSSTTFRLPGVQTEYEFWHDLAHRLGAGAFFPWGDERELNRWLLGGSDLTLEELEAHPEGVRYGELDRSDEVRERFATPSGKVELVSQLFASHGYDRLPTYTRPSYLAEPDPERPFVLVTGARVLPFVASRYRNLPSLQKLTPAVEMGPEDAEGLGVADGDRVRLSSRTGALDVPVRVLPLGGIVRGVVQLTHGWRDANANLLTPDDRFDPISGFPTVKEVPVRIEGLGTQA